MRYCLYFAVILNQVSELMTPQLFQLPQFSILSVRKGKKEVCQAKVSANISSSARCCSFLLFSR